MRNRFDSGAVASLSTEMFHEESLSSVLRFNPSAMASPLLDPAQSDNTSFEFIANRKLITNGEVMKKVFTHHSLTVFIVSLSEAILLIDFASAKEWHC